jgi:hypothetical protein
MGFEPMELGLLHYAHQLGLGVADLNEIEVLETKIETVRKSFKPHDKTPLQMQWQEPRARDLLVA